MRELSTLGAALAHALVPLATDEVARALAERVRPGSNTQVARLTARLAAHRAVDRSPAWLDGLDAAGLRTALTASDDERVVAELAANVDTSVLAGYIEEAGDPPPVVLAAAAKAAAAGDGACVWALLPFAAAPMHVQIVQAAAAQITTRSQFVRWLCAACAHPDHLDVWAGTVPAELVPAVTRYAHLHTRGKDVRAALVRDLSRLARTGVVPRWMPAGLIPGMFSWSRPQRWAGLLQASGPFDELGAAALRRLPAMEVPLVLNRPRWDKCPAAPRARAAILGVRLPRDARQVDRVLDQAQLAVARDPLDVVWWACRRRRPPAEQLQALARLQAERDKGESYSLLLPAAARLACVVDAGRPAREVLQFAERMLRRALQQYPSWAFDEEMTTSLLDVARARGAGRSLGPCSVQVVLADGVAATPHWMVRALTEYLAGVPQVADPRFVQVLLDLSEQFTGTFDDLIATTRAVLA